MQHLEVETKFELRREDFERVKTLGRVTRCRNQLNIYYDAQWKLAENSSTLRIRFDDQSAPVLALKIPVAQRRDRRIMREFELTLSRRYFQLSGSLHPTTINVEQQLPEELSECLRRFEVRQVYRVGWVRNSRLVIQVDDVGEVELDRLQLPDGTVAHEVEIESSDDQAHTYLANLVRRVAPDASPSSMSKFQRFRHAAMRTAPSMLASAACQSRSVVNR